MIALSAEELAHCARDPFVLQAIARLHEQKEQTARQRSFGVVANTHALRAKELRAEADHLILTYTGA